MCQTHFSTHESITQKTTPPSHGVRKKEIPEYPLNSVFASLDHNEPFSDEAGAPTAAPLEENQAEFSVTANVSNSETESNFMNK